MFKVFGGVSAACDGEVQENFPAISEVFWAFFSYEMV